MDFAVPMKIWGILFYLSWNEKRQVWPCHELCKNAAEVLFISVICVSVFVLVFRLFVSDVCIFIRLYARDVSRKLCINTVVGMAREVLREELNTKQREKQVIGHSNIAMQSESKSASDISQHPCLKASNCGKYGHVCDWSCPWFIKVRYMINVTKIWLTASLTVSDGMNDNSHTDHINQTLYPKRICAALTILVPACSRLYTGTLIDQ